MKINCYLIPLFSLLSTVLFTQSYIYGQINTWECYSTTEVVKDILTDGASVWTATYGGVSYLNNSGSTPQVYTTCNSSLISNQVNGIAQTDDGVLWFATETGLSSFDGNSVWTDYSTANSNIPGDRIRCISAKGNDVWIGTWNNGVGHFNGTSWTSYNDLNSGLAANRVDEIIITDDAIWMAVYNEGINRFKNNSWDLYGFFDGVCLVMHAFVIDTGGTLWAASGASCSGNYLDYFDGTNWIKVTPPSGYGFLDIVVDSLNTMWFATSGGHVVTFNGTTWTEYDNSNVPELPSEQFNAIGISADGHKWVGAGGQCFEFDDTNWYEHFVGNSALPSNYVNSVSVASNNDKWVCTPTGLIKLSAGIWSLYTKENSGIHASWIEEVDFDTNGDIWAMSTDSISVFDGTVWTTITNIPINYYRGLVIDQNGVKWIGSSQSGLAKYEAGVWVTYNMANSNLNNDNIYGLELDNSGNLWIRNFYGLMMFDGSTWTDYSSDIPGNGPDDVAIELNGSAWVATWNGLAYFDGVSTWTTYTSSSVPGMPMEDISSIEIDDNGDKWFGTLQGLMHYDGTTWTLFNESNSVLPENKIDDVTNANDQTIWLATYGGGLVGTTHDLVATIPTINDELLKLTVYPNPASEIVTISTNLKHDETALDLVVYSAGGAKVYSQKVFGELTKVDIASFDSGNYILVLSNKYLKMSRKFAVSK